MHLQIVLILFSINFCNILTQNAAYKNLFKKVNRPTDNNDDIDDTPSPEWIKYQQERYQGIDKLSSSHPPPTKSSFSKVDLSEMETTSRQESSTHQDEVQKDKFENNNSQDKVTSQVEFPSLHGFIKFIKSLKQNWMKKSLFRLDDKIKMLYQLKDSLLKTLEQQFQILWQDDDGDENQMDTTDNGEGREIHEIERGSHSRSKRGILDESSINFPPEAALLSINFLTFAVFLIKLVLQVVNIVKTKHYQFSTLNMDTGAIRNG